MSKPLNTTEKKLQFHCSVCQATWQLLVLRTDCLTNPETKCLNNCLEKWQTLLIAYCQEQIILDFIKKEQQRQSLFGDQKDEQSEELAEWLEKIKKQTNPK